MSRGSGMANPFAGFRRDKAEPAIVEYLRLHGLMVWRIHGEGVFDLLIWSGKGKALYGIEVKGARGKLTPAQERTFAVFRGERVPVAVARGPEQALELVQAWDRERCTTLSP